MNLQNNKVVVTAIGLCSPLGFSLESFYNNYKSADTEKSLVIDDKDLETKLSTFKKIDQRRMDRITKIAMLSAVTCWEDADLVINEETVNHVGGIFGTEYGPIASARNFVQSGFDLGLNSASPLLFPYTVGNAAPGAITILMGSRGFNTTLSGHNPVAYSYDVLRSGKAKAVLSGGFEELAPEIATAYAHRTIINKKANKEPASVNKLSEGSAMLFMEEQSFALARNANVLFEVCGYGVSSNPQQNEISFDNFGHIDEHVIIRSMIAALQRSGIMADEVSQIVSLSRQDSGQTASEAAAIKAVWKESNPKVHFIKHVLGETFGSSGTFAAVLGYVIGKEVKSKTNQKTYVMVNSYHIGGNCFSVVIAL